MPHCRLHGRGAAAEAKFGGHIFDQPDVSVLSRVPVALRGGILIKEELVTSTIYTPMSLTGNKQNDSPAHPSNLSNRDNIHIIRGS